MRAVWWVAGGRARPVPHRLFCFFLPPRRLQSSWSTAWPSTPRPSPTCARTITQTTCEAGGGGRAGGTGRRGGGESLPTSPPPPARQGTTLAGLVAASDHVPHAGRDFYDAWHDAVHATLPLESMLRPDPAVRAVLASLPQKLVIFTNADRAHAVRCLELLELRDLFPDTEKDVICFETIMDAAEAAGLVRRGRPVVAKPADAAVRLALAHAGVGVGAESRVAFFDDSARNVAACSAAGVASVLVGRTGVAGVDAVAQVASVADLPTALPSLWTAHGLSPPPPRPAAAAAADAAAAAAAANLETLDQVRNALPDPRRRASLDSAGSPREPLPAPSLPARPHV